MALTNQLCSGLDSSLDFDQVASGLNDTIISFLVNFLQAEIWFLLREKVDQEAQQEKCKSHKAI